MARFIELVEERGIVHAVIEPTPTALAGSVVDATASVRLFLKRTGLHDYDAQARGPKSKVRLTAHLFEKKEVLTTTATFYKPKSNGDPRLWISGLNHYAKPGNKILLLERRGSLCVINLSSRRVMASSEAFDSPLAELLLQLSKRVSDSSPRGSLDDAATSEDWSASSTEFDPTVHVGMMKLQERAFGGSDVAVRPDAQDETWWPKGPTLSGIAELTSDLLRKTGSTDCANLYFLVGGAGNGKSFAARIVTNELGLASADGSGLAQRLYAGMRGSCKVAILNDATIAPSSQYGSDQALALATDLEGWRKIARRNPVVVLCCVNRGIIADELRVLAERESGGHQFSKYVLNWLASSNAAPPELPKGFSRLDEPPIIDLPHFRQEVLLEDGRKCRLHALAVDSTSLLEADSGETTAAGELFAKVVAKFDEELQHRPTNCPVAANFRQFADGGHVRWAELLSASEIASGRLFSYRDMWGAIALTLLGPRVSGSESAISTLQFIDQLLETFAISTDPFERLDTLFSLSRFRSHNSLFRAAIPRAADGMFSSPPGVPFFSGFAFIDPAYWGSEISRVVDDAMQAISLAEKPSAVLRASELWSGSWSAFDDCLEDALLACIGSPACGDILRRKLISWYGASLSRLATLATGLVGNADSIKLWRTCYTVSKFSSSPLPPPLDDSLRSILFPASPDAASHNILIPAFSVRSEPLTHGKSVSGAQLAESVSHASLALRVSSAGRRLTLECFQTGTGRAVGEVTLDCSLLREALGTRNGRPCQTESTAFVEPRLERCRASSLASLPETQKRLVALVDGTRQEIS